VHRSASQAPSCPRRPGQRRLRPGEDVRPRARRGHRRLSRVAPSGPDDAAHDCVLLSSVPPAPPGYARPDLPAVTGSAAARGRVAGSGMPGGADGGRRMPGWAPVACGSRPRCRATSTAFCPPVPRGPRRSRRSACGPCAGAHIRAVPQHTHSERPHARFARKLLRSVISGMGQGANGERWTAWLWPISPRQGVERIVSWAG
jgi:hypothetical protein